MSKKKLCIGVLIISNIFIFCIGYDLRNQYTDKIDVKYVSVIKNKKITKKVIEEANLVRSIYPYIKNEFDKYYYVHIKEGSTHIKKSYFNMRKSTLFYVKYLENKYFIALGKIYDREPH